MVKNTQFLIWYKVFFALLGFSAVVTEIATLTTKGIFNPANFFSYFTIETNIFVVVVLLISAVLTAAKKNDKIAALRSAATVFIVIVGIGFAVLLSGIKDAAFTAVPWDNIVLHYIMPVAVLVDYLIDRPRHKLSFKRNVPWLLVPVVYTAYSLVRGSFVGWYPYPFLNPTVQSYTSIFVTVFGLLLLGLALTWLTCKLSGKK